jgi:hypothetical protein
MNASLVLKQDQGKALQLVSNTYRKHNPTSALQSSIIFHPYRPVRGHFGGTVDITTKTGVVSG